MEEAGKAERKGTLGRYRRKWEDTNGQLKNRTHFGFI
jgi:hypothetical protein